MLKPTYHNELHNPGNRIEEAVGLYIIVPVPSGFRIRTISPGIVPCEKIRYTQAKVNGPCLDPRFEDWCKRRTENL